MKRFATLSLALVTTAFATATPAAADGGPPVVWTLTLEGAEHLKGGDLVVVLERREDTVRGFALTPKAGKASHDVTVGDVIVTAEKVEGQIEVKLHTDGWWPADPAAAEPYRLTVERDGDTAVGTWRPGGESADGSEGKITGTVTAAEPSDTPTVVRLHLFQTPIPGVKKWQTEVLLTLTFDPHGKAVGCISRVTGSPTYAVWTGYVEDLKVTLHGGELAGTLTLDAKTGRGETVRLPIAIKAVVLGDRAGGSYLVADESATTGRAVGEVLPTPPADGPTPMQVELYDALPSGDMLRLYLAAGADGGFASGFGFSPTYNRAVHQVDTAGLQREGDRVKGSIAVTVRPDPYVPKDGKPQTHTITIDAKVNHGAVTGTFGRDESTAGRLVGRALPPAPDQPIAGVWVKFEQGIIGGNPWFNRSFASVKYEDGKVAGGSFSYNKNGWKGEFNDADLAMKGGRLTGTIDGTVTSGKTRTGKYTFKLDAHVIGDMIAGSADVLYEGTKVKTTDVLGSVNFESD